MGPYELLRPLDRSGLFLGRSPDGERVAVTVVPADVAVDPGFRADVAAARLVTGAFIAPVLDADLDAPVPWLATAYIDAPSLADKIRDGGPLHASAVLALATWLTIGLQALHAAGVVHRNLNPSNVLLTEDGPRLVEFGISLPAKASAQPDEDFDSPEFSSPEQALGHDIGSASDIFSLGAVLMYAASGHGPFGSGSSAALMYRLVNSPPDLGELPDELRRPVEACLAKQPSSRPTASRLLAEFRAIRPRARAEEVPARPAPGPAAAGAVAGAGAALSATVSSPRGSVFACGCGSARGGGSACDRVFASRPVFARGTVFACGCGFGCGCGCGCGFARDGTFACGAVFARVRGFAHVRVSV